MKKTFKTMSLRKKIAGLVMASIILVLTFSVGALFEDIDAGEIVVIQAPITGTLSIYYS